MALDRVSIDCTEGKVQRYFAILASWVAGYMDNVTLHRLKSDACSTREVPTGEIGTNIRNYRARDYSRYERDGYENLFPGSKSDCTRVEFCSLGIHIGQKIFDGLYWVSAPAFYTPDMLHRVYLGIFKHIMDWIQGFQKKHR